MRRLQMRSPQYSDQPQARIRLSPWNQSTEPGEDAAQGQDPFPQTRLRWRWLGGYRREDVELLLTECRLLIRQVERRLETMRDRERQHEQELSGLRAQLAGAQAKAEASRGLEGVVGHAEKLEQTASEQALWLTLLGEREGQTDEERTRIQELLRLNHELLWNVQGLVESARTTAERPAAERPEEPAPVQVAEPEPEPVPETPQATVEIEPAPEPEAAAEPEPTPELEATEEPQKQEAEEASEPEPETRVEITTHVQAAPRDRSFAGPSFSPARAVFGAAAALLILAIVLAATGHATAAVILLAVFALGIAFLSIFGIGVDVSGMPIPRHRPPASAADEGWEQTRLRTELAQLGAERDRRLLELGDAVNSGDDHAVAELRDRIRLLDRLIQERALGFASQRRTFADAAVRHATRNGDELTY